MPTNGGDPGSAVFLSGESIGQKQFSFAGTVTSPPVGHRSRLANARGDIRLWAIPVVRRVEMGMSAAGARLTHDTDPADRRERRIDRREEPADLAEHLLVESLSPMAGRRSKPR